MQTRYGLREIAPRLLAGFLAGAFSLLGSGIAIELANALSAAVLAGGVDPVDGAAALRQLIGGSLTAATPGPVPGTGLLIVGLIAAAILQMLLLVYIVRVAITVALIAGAPLALMLHALPQTDGIARWWWRAFAGCLAVQVAQSLTLAATVKVFFTPGGITGGLFGTVPGSDWARTLVVLALLILLWRIPFWILRAVRGGGSGRSLIGSIVRTAILIKTAGLIGGRGGIVGFLAGGRRRRPGPPPGPTGPGARGPRPRPGPSGGGAGLGGGDPYAQTRATASGQLMLPLGVRRQPRPPAAPAGRARPGVPHGLQGRQLALPLAEGLWPEHRPVLGPDGQYRLPLDVTRTARPTPPSTPSAGSVRARPPAGRQLELPLDPYRGNRPLRSGQYPLPFDGLARHPRPHLPTPTPAAGSGSGGPARPGGAAGPPRGRQLRLPLTPPTRTAPPPVATPPHADPTSPPRTSPPRTSPPRTSPPPRRPRPPSSPARPDQPMEGPSS